MKWTAKDKFCLNSDVRWPFHLSLDSKCNVLVANRGHDCILLLTSQLELERVLVDEDYPTRLHYNDRTAQLYVAHDSRNVWAQPQNNTISLYNLR